MPGILLRPKFGNALLDNTFGVGSIIPGGNVGKIVLAGGALAAVGVASYFGGQKQSQALGQTQKAQTGGYTFYAQPGSTVNVSQPKTGSIEQTAEAKQQATQIDTGGIMNILLVVAALIGLSMFMKK